MPTWPTTASDASHPFGTGLFWGSLTSEVAVAPAIGTPLGTFLGSLAGVPIAGTPWAEIGLITRITTPERTAGDTKITHLKSPNKAHEYFPGYVEGGTLTCRILHSPVAHALIAALAPTAESVDQRVVFAVQFADGPVVFFDGYVKSSPVEVSDGDDPIAIDVTIKVSGDLTLAL